jgi:hypothetical protein
MKAKISIQIIGSKFIQLIFLLIIGLHCVQAENHLGKHKQNKNKITKHIVIPDSISEAKVILMPTGIPYHFEVNEVILNKHGCTFITSDEQDISRLRIILKEANIKLYPYKINLIRTNDGEVHESDFLYSQWRISNSKRWNFH